MPDLTDADLEAMEKRRVRASNELYNVNHLRGNASTALEEDLPALIAALREARAERDAMSNLYAHEGHKSLVLLNENTSLLAENRLLRDIVQTARLFLEANPELNGTGPLRGDMEALDCSPSATAAEVERVKALEENAWPSSCDEGCDGCPPPNDCPLLGRLADCAGIQVEQVKRLEKVAEAAKVVVDNRDDRSTDDGLKSWSDTDDMMALDAALAELDAGEVNDVRPC